MGSLRKCVAALAVGGAAFSAAPAAAADCPNADAQPDEISATDFAGAVLCEANAIRRIWARPPLTPQRNLSIAAGWHAADMVSAQYFDHSSPVGETLADRLDRVNFIPTRSDRWRAAENLAAGSGPSGTAAAIVAGWMNSHDHRIDLLDPSFTMVGIGVARGWPLAGDDQPNAMTIDMDLGWRAANRRSSG
jgi:uncharacterized protein YkwD